MLKDYRGGEGVTLAVRVTPRAARAEVAGLSEGAVRVRVTSPPVGGEATRQAVAMVADLFHLPPSCVRCLRGERSRDKLLLLTGISREKAEGILSHLRSETQG